MQETNTDLDRFVHALGTEYERELLTESAIDPEVARERGYRALGRPNEGVYDNSPVTGLDSRAYLSKIGFPSWAIREDYYFPGLWIPGWDVRGRMTPGQWKPRNPVPNRDGKRMKYTGAKGQATRLDVHPRWTRGGEIIPPIKDVAVPLWITEGVKKADSLTSRGVCTVALSGVYNWRNSLGTLGDWEDVPLRGREVTICFDADARSKPDVAQAMERLGRWLRSRGVAKVWYLVVPGETVTPAGVTQTKGVDDYLAAGGLLKTLEQSREPNPPKIPDTTDTYTDARLAETIALEVLDGRYCFIPASKGGTWREWNGQRWTDTHEVSVQETCRQWALDRFAEAAGNLRDSKDGAAVAVDGLRPLLGSSRLKAVLGLARGVAEVVRADADFDRDPDLLNTPGGIVDLRTGEIHPHSPEYMMTRITRVTYRPGARHEAWDAALSAIPDGAGRWLQVRLGQAATGHQADDGRMVLLDGTGDNGKTLLIGSVFQALGGGEGETGYAVKVPNTLLLKGKALGAATPEKMTLRACRMAYIEETPEESYLDSNVVKEILDAAIIDGRELYRGTTSFRPSHSMFLNTNHPPIVSDTGHGSWRRLSRVTFPYTFTRNPSKPTDRPADPTLKRRMEEPEALEAALAWVIEGAAEWYAAGQVLTKDDPECVREALSGWRMDSDTVLRFLTERCTFDPDRFVSSSDLYAEYRAWLEAHGHKRQTSTTFKAKITDHTGLPGRVTFGKKRFTGPGWSPLPRGTWASQGVPSQGVAALGLAWRDPEG